MVGTQSHGAHYCKAATEHPENIEAAIEQQGGKETATEFPYDKGHHNGTTELQDKKEKADAKEAATHDQHPD